MGAALSVLLIRFALHPLLTKTTEIGWSEVGKIDEFASLTAPVKRVIKVEQLDAWRKIISEKPVYLVPAKNGTVRVLSPVCPHLGCSIPWNENEARVHLSVPRSSLCDGRRQDLGPGSALNG
jgi:menaquinol-cytochrome c reductase iron-sulfur subunit